MFSKIMFIYHFFMTLYHTPHTIKEQTDDRHERENGRIFKGRSIIDKVIYWTAHKSHVQLNTLN